MGGIFGGALIANSFLMSGAPIEVSPALQSELAGYGLSDYSYMLPKELFSFESLLTVRGFIIMVVGGFLVGFGTRLGCGCTSGHGISGISRFSLRSIIATVTFMIVGILTVLITGIL